MDLKKVTDLMLQEINLLYDYRCGNQEGVILHTINDRIAYGNNLILSKAECTPREKRRFFLYSYVAERVIEITNEIIYLKNNMLTMIRQNEHYAFNDMSLKIDEKLDNLATLFEDTISLETFIKNAHGTLKYYRFIVLEQNNPNIKTK